MSCFRTVARNKLCFVFFLCFFFCGHRGLEQPPKFLLCFGYGSVRVQSLCSHSAVDFVPESCDLKYKPLGALSVSWLCEIEQNGVQEAVHAGKRPGTFVNNGKQVPGLARCTR